MRFVFFALLIVQMDYAFSHSITFEGVREGKPLKRSKEYQMYWSGSLATQIVSVQFRKNNWVAHEGPGFLKSGKYQVHVPGNLLGTYTLVVLDPSTQAVLQSDEVTIKRSIPLAGQIGIAIGIALLISFITV